MKNRISSLPSSSNVSRGSGDLAPAEAASGSGSATGAGANEGAHLHSRSLKNRLLSCLGMSPGATLDASNGSRFTQGASGSAALPGAGQASARQLRRGNRDTAMLAQSIRTKLAELPGPVAARFDRQLQAALQRDDAGGRISTLTMLESNISHASQRSVASSSTASLASALSRSSTASSRSSLLTRSSSRASAVTVNFADVRVDLPETQAEQVMSIRFRLLKLPSALATDYQSLLRDVLAAEDPTQRTTNLSRMSRQIDEHLKP